jgi:hypothetical protein
MSEQEFSKRLQRGEDPIDVAALTARVLRRDRRRVWLLGIACIIAWMAVVMLPWATLLPMLAKVAEYQANLSAVPALPPAEQKVQSLLVLQAVKLGTVLTFLGSVGSMFVASLCTVLLILASRRATLRQVNARLAEISSQVRALAKG